MRWFVSEDGNEAKAMEQDALLAALKSGRLKPAAQVCREGTRDWVEAGSLLRPRTDARVTVPLKPVRPGGPWMLALSALTFLVLATTGVLLWRLLVLEDVQRARAADQDARLGRIEAELQKANGNGAWVKVQEVHHNCYTDRTNVTCTFTNLSDRDVQTCTQGTLRQKEAVGVKLESVVICTGRLRPGETRSVSAPWVGGFADDICFKENAYGKTLDWGKCSFDTEPYDLPTVRKVSDAVEKAGGG